MPATSPAPGVPVPGFIDHHAHLLREAAGVATGGGPDAVRTFHQRLASQGSTPMDVLDPPSALALPELASRLVAGLHEAARAGLVEVTEMGMRSWAYLDALLAATTAGPLPARVRIYLASGLADEAGLAGIEARRSAAAGPWLRLDGVKFYADGWLVPRTCAVEEGFADTADHGILFAAATRLADRIRPLADRGWRIATHAIGDRAVAAVLDAYDLAWDRDPAAIAAAAPRIEHASVLSRELIERMAAAGVVACIQPSFAVSDASELEPALGPARAMRAYPWTELANSGVRMLAGSDYPIEVLDPLPGLARLVSGSSRRPGFATGSAAPPQALLPVRTAFGLMTDAAAGRTWLSADPRSEAPGQLDAITVLGAEPDPF